MELYVPGFKVSQGFRFVIGLYLDDVLQEVRRV
jgi:hypothetical protein